jgi:hypothetical protein
MNSLPLATTSWQNVQLSEFQPCGKAPMDDVTLLKYCRSDSTSEMTTVGTSRIWAARRVKPSNRSPCVLESRESGRAC